MEYVKFEFLSCTSITFYHLPATSIMQWPIGQKELEYGVMLGSFPGPPFNWTMNSLLLTRDKSNGLSKRMIMDLSFPEGRSVNNSIARNEFCGQQFKMTLPNTLTFKERLQQWWPYHSCGVGILWGPTGNCGVALFIIRYSDFSGKDSGFWMLQFHLASGPVQNISWV